MKRNLILFLGGALLFCISFLIYSCKKNYDENYDNAGVLSDDLLNAAKEWHSQQTNGNKVLSNNSKNTLLPRWKEAALNKLTNGQAQIIVPSPEFPLGSKSTAGVVRKFVFEQNKGAIINGMIIEIYSDKQYIASNKSSLIENYFKGTMKDFSGTVIIYDVNYKYLRSYVYKNGSVVPGVSVIKPKGGGAADNKSSTTSITTLTCIDWYWVTYWPNGYVTENYLYTTCDGSSEYGGGGGSPSGGCGMSANNTLDYCNIPAPVTPCAAKSNAILNSTFANTLYAARNNWLTWSFEGAYLFTDQNNINTYNFQFGNSGQPYVDVQTSVPISGMVHTHPSGTGVSMAATPTPDDYGAIWGLLNDGKISNPATFTSTVLTPSSAYMVTIDNATTLQNWGATNFQIQSNGETRFYNDVSLMASQLVAAPYYWNSIDAQESATLYYLQNSGIALIRGNINNLYDSSEWKPLAFNTGNANVFTTPCP